MRFSVMLAATLGLALLRSARQASVQSAPLTYRRNPMSFLARSRQIPLSLVCLLLICVAPSVHASNPLQFNGLTRTISLGSISLSSPSGIAVDPSGNIYISDTANQQIVMVNPQGVASVLAISGLSPGLSNARGIALDGSGNLYIADAGNNRVVMVTPAGVGSVVSMGSVTLLLPRAVAVDNSGNLFIADTSHNRIVVVPSGGAAAVDPIVVSSGIPTLFNPSGVAVDTSGNLYIADTGLGRIVKVAAGSTIGTVITYGGNVSSPWSIAVDAIGNLYVSDTSDGGHIAQVDTSGNVGILTVSPTSPTSFNPWGTAVDIFGAVYIPDNTNNRILVVNPQFNASLTNEDRGYSLNKTAVGFGHIQLGSTTGTSLALPFHIASTPMHSVKVFTQGTQNLDFTATGACPIDTVNSNCTVTVQFLPTAPGLRTGSVVLYDSSQNVMMSIPLYGFSDAPVAALAPNTGTVVSTGGVTLNYPFQIALDGAGNIYDANNGGNLVKIPAGGGTASVITPSGYTFGSEVTGVVLDGAGNLFISDHNNNRIIVITPGGVASALTINGLSSALDLPTALAFDGAGNLYISDWVNGRVVKVSCLNVSGSTSTGLGTVIGTGSYTTTTDGITGVAVDWMGNIYIPDGYAGSDPSRIIKVTAAGAASLVTPTGITFNSPRGVSADGMGNIYIADGGNNRIVEITTAGVASVLAVTGLPTPTTLNSLFGSTVDPSGNLYIPDSGNNRILFVNVSGASLASFASTNVGSTSSDSPKTATVTNLGNLPLTISANPGYTADYTENLGDTNLCTSATSLTAGTACDVSVKFTPQSVGLLSENIVVTDNTLNVAASTQNVAATGTGLQPGDTTSTTVAIVPTSLVVGQPATTITATIADTQSGHTSTVPTGTVSTYTDTLGGTVSNLIASPATLSSGKVILSSVLLSGVGTHTITANYAGVTGSFLTSNGSTPVVVSKASVTVAGPATQPITVVNSQSGTIPITVTGQYAGTGIPLPTGTISYTIVNSSSTTVASGSPTLTAGTGNATASIPVASTLAAGSYTVTVTYSGDANFAIPASATTITLQVGQIQPVIVWSQPSAIAYGTTLSGVLNAVAQNQTTAPVQVKTLTAQPEYGVSTVAGTYVYTATPTGGTATTVTATTVLAAGSYTLNVSFTPTNTTTFKSATGSVTLTVTKATPGVVLTSNSNPVLVQNSITLTATVSSSISTPTGTVSFLDGATAIGTGTVNSSGVATYSTAALAVGTHSITAVYSGDTNFLTVTSSATSEVVQDFNLTLSITGGSAGATTVTAQPGGTAVYTFTLSPVGSTTFPATVTLSASGLPAGATYTISPATLAAGTGSTTVTLTIQLPQFSAVHEQPFMKHGAQPGVLAQNKPVSKHASGLPYLALAVLLLPFAGRMRKTGKRLGRLLPLLLLLVAGLAATAGLSGCTGLNSGYFGQAQTTYTITVTGTSGTLVHSTSVTLIVQ
jgi:sugar lactone lactonase YvrE